MSRGGRIDRSGHWWSPDAPNDAFDALSAPKASFGARSPAGQYKLTANEVAIGLTLPRAAVEILRQRLTPAYLVRAATLAEPFSPANAVEAGFLDQVVDAGQLPDVARGVAGAMAGLDMAAHAATKLRVRQHTLDALRAAIDADHAEFRRRSLG